MDDSVLHRIDHLGRSTFVLAATAFDLEQIGLIRWHHNDLSGPKTIYTYRAVTHYDDGEQTLKQKLHL
jgi:hypothetical protein